MSMFDFDLLREGINAGDPFTGMVEHLDGVWWHEAPLPRRWHRCSTQTVGHAYGKLVERCACGAIRFDEGLWRDKNARRRYAQRWTVDR